MVYLLARVSLLLVRLCEIYRRVFEQREVEPIKPNYWVLSFITVIMPMPRWRQNNIATLHGHFLAFHCGEAVFAFYDEAQREGNMPVCRGCFVWKYQLKPTINGIGGVWCVWSCVSYPVNRYVYHQVLRTHARIYKH